MHTHDRNTGMSTATGHCCRSPDPRLWTWLIKHSTNEALPGRANQEREMMGVESLEPTEQLEVLLDVLGKSEPRVPDDLVCQDTYC